MSEATPDLAALYLKYRDAMHRVAASVLRDVGRESEAADAVSDAIVSILKRPPRGVRNWEAFLVTAAKRKALDRVRSAEVRHSASEVEPEYDQADASDIAGDVAEDIDRARLAAVAWDCLSVLDERHRKAVWQFVALERPRAEVAAGLGVTPARVSQMVGHALELLRDEMKRREGEDEQRRA